MGIDQKKLEKKLKERVEANYRSYLMQMQNKLATEIIGQAAEIAATKLVYDELMKGCKEDYTDYLLRFENPLELVRDQWMIVQNESYSQELVYVLWQITDKGLGEGEYALLNEQSVAGLEEGVHLC